MGTNIIVESRTYTVAVVHFSHYQFNCFDGKNRCCRSKCSLNNDQFDRKMCRVILSCRAYEIHFMSFLHIKISLQLQVYHFHIVGLNETCKSIFRCSFVLASRTIFSFSLSCVYLKSSIHIHKRFDIIK